MNRLQATATDPATSTSPAYHLHRTTPEPLRPVAISLGRMNEVLWKFFRRLDRHDTFDNMDDLHAWILRDQRLDAIDLGNPDHIARAEQIRVEAILAETSIDRWQWSCNPGPPEPPMVEQSEPTWVTST